ncbi:hypothetical protein [Campylobacter sp.]|uniref:hypothetical protein n=1 Tax=Campylobacter sp. TaxID=205 RepID=UPI002A836948|nr:hypothetical protein [Campylobacter sp.]MDY4446515.1 hypothetical protein [Campylobacter sp.]
MSAIKTKRIALNETARAYNDARAFEYANSDDIQVVKIQMSITHPRTDICDYYAGVDKYGLGAGVYPKDKAPVPPFHPFCRCQMIPKYAGEYSKPKLNANADKEYLLGLKEWQRARILGSKAKASEALKTGDINSVFNAMKPERYKVKNINEVVEKKQVKQTINADINNNIGVKPSINSYQNEDMRDLVRIIEEKKVEYIAPKRLRAKLSNDEIIDKISGGDKTGGSCYSVALAYIANKAGIDVRDFRGGESMKAMREGHIRYFTRFVGVQNVYIDRFQVMDTLIKKLEFGEEYLLAFGRHAAIVRKTDKYIEYLELQAPNRKDNGFKILSVLNLPQRFLREEDNKNDIYSASIFNIKKLYNNDDFFKLTGYFNTKNGFEMKGEDGEIK